MGGQRKAAKGDTENRLWKKLPRGWTGSFIGPKRTNANSLCHPGLQRHPSATRGACAMTLTGLRCFPSAVSQKSAFEELGHPRSVSLFLRRCTGKTGAESAQPSAEGARQERTRVSIPCSSLWKASRPASLTGDHGRCVAGGENEYAFKI